MKVMTSTRNTKTSAISITLEEPVIQFIDDLSVRKKLSRSRVTNQLLKQLRKQAISYYFEAEALSDTPEDLAFVNAGWDSYLENLDHNES